MFMIDAFMLQLRDFCLCKFYLPHFFSRLGYSLLRFNYLRPILFVKQNTIYLSFKRITVDVARTSQIYTPIDET